MWHWIYAERQEAHHKHIADVLFFQQRFRLLPDQLENWSYTLGISQIWANGFQKL